MRGKARNLLIANIMLGFTAMKSWCNWIGDWQSQKSVRPHPHAVAAAPPGAARNSAGPSLQAQRAANPSAQPIGLGPAIPKFGGLKGRDQLKSRAPAARRPPPKAQSLISFGLPLFACFAYFAVKNSPAFILHNSSFILSLLPPFLTIIGYIS